jgi:hypothetical protein
MPGIIEVSRAVPIGRAIDDIVLLIECSVAGEWKGKSSISYCSDNGSAEQGAAADAPALRKVPFA